MSKLRHLDEAGAARMVDVSSRPDTERYARAAGEIRMRATTLAAIEGAALAKGDVIAVARVAGIMAAKRTAELIPLCHPLPLSDVQVSIVADATLPGLRVEAAVRTTAGTGVEMEAITAAAVTLITVYDMTKSVDREMEICNIRLLEKSGGRSGNWQRG